MPNLLHTALIRSLLNPSRYPHSVSEIAVCETHISWVLLTGDYAYKIKKPVKLSFLDFSTLELRKHYCEEELRLNRRFAPTLYVDVVAITGTPDTAAIGGTGPIVDYAVKLRQFKTSDELSQLIATNSATCEDLTNFGHTLAKLHGSLPRVHDASLQAWQLAADQTIDDLTRSYQDSKRMAKIATQLDTLKEPLAAQLHARYRSHAIRECHGDLHLGNVVRIDGALTPFDCIEFDAALRNIDMLNDAAFLFMDLEAHARRDLAYCFLNAWLEENGDYSALPLLPYYAAHRALVRAKIATLNKSGQEAVECYVQEAERRLLFRPPLLLITCGLSGSGKTWLSKQLASSLPAVHVRSDIERKRLAGIAALDSSASAPGAGIYTLEFNTQTYARLRECARAALVAGESVIVDAAFLRRDERADFHTLASECHAYFSILHCVAPEDTLSKRIRSRQQTANDASEATVDVLAEQLDYWEPLTASESASSLRIDTAIETKATVLDKLAALKREAS